MIDEAKVRRLEAQIILASTQSPLEPAILQGLVRESVPPDGGRELAIRAALYRRLRQKSFQNINTV